MKRCPRCGLPAWSRICGSCGFARPFAWEHGSYITGQVVVYEERPHIVVRHGVHPPKGSLYDFAGERWWVLDAERGGLTCVDQADFEGRPLGRSADQESIIKTDEEHRPAKRMDGDT